MNINDVTPLRLNGFDNCIVGVSTRCGQTRVVYDVDKMLKKLSQKMSKDEALKYYYSKIENDWQGESTPIFLHKTTYEEIVESAELNGIN